MFGYLRFFLAGLVVLSHVGYSCHTINVGAVAVAIFFMLSGYVVTHLLIRVFKPGRTLLWRFYLERLLRIFPLYLWVVGVTVAFLLATGFGETRFPLPQVLRNIFVVPLNFFMIWDCNILHQPRAWLIPPAWSLGAELLAYLLLPLIIFHRPAKVFAVALSLVIFSLATMTVFNTEYFAYRLHPGILFPFVLGSTIYKRVHEPQTCDRFDQLFVPWCYGLCIALLIINGIAGRLDQPYAADVLLGVIIGVPVVTYLGALRITLPLNRTFADLSYGLFLAHSLGIWFLMRFAPYVNVRSPAAVAFIVAFATGVSLAGVLIVEAPLHRLRRLLGQEFPWPKNQGPIAALPVVPAHVS